MDQLGGTFSFWDFSRTETCDTLVIGAGFSGLRIARFLKQERPQWNITVLDRLPIGAAASTRNAGFACFGSPSEILSDLKLLGPQRCRNLLERRINGVNQLRSELRDADLEHGEFGGFEVFFSDQPSFQETVFDGLHEVNELLSGLMPESGLYTEVSINKFNMAFSDTSLYTSLEFQLNPAELHASYTNLAQQKGVEIFRGLEVLGFRKENGGWDVTTDQGLIHCNRLIYCGNGGARSGEMDPAVDPARGQIILTNELDELNWKGNFHIYEGYYYFRNYGKRVLLGGARHLDKQAERTHDLGQSDPILTNLEHVLKHQILPKQKWDIDRRWSGTMGFRRDGSKEVVVDSRAPNFWSVYGFGGMGVALHIEATDALLNRILNDG